MSQNNKRQAAQIMNSDKRKTKRNKTIPLENSPPVHTLEDLISLGKQIKFYKNINSVMLWKITPHLDRLNNMVGMKKLKETVFFQVLYYLQNMHKQNKNDEYLHTIIMGSPGSGKTTVAKIIGDIYRSIGVLSPKGKFRIAYRDDFVAQYLGQTAIKTRKLLESCIGGVLFIDEVYSLAPQNRDKDSFAKEALDTLTAFLSEHKNDFCCIAAGYKDDIYKCFFNMNKGLERRFPWYHEIDGYTSKQLTEIFLIKINNMNWEWRFDKTKLTKLLKENKEYFKYSGGDIETFLTKCKMMHSKRVFNLDKKYKFIITLEDLQETIEYMKKSKKIVDNSPPPGLYI